MLFTEKGIFIMYRKEWNYSRKTPFVEVMAKNGAVIAECKTKAMADKIIRGLILLREEEIKMRNFRL